MKERERRFGSRYEDENHYGKEDMVYHRWCNLDSANEFTIQEAGVTYPCPEYYVKRLNNEICAPNVFTLEYVCAGSGYIETATQTYHVRAGDTYLLRWQEEYLYYSDPEDPFEKLWINFSGNIIRGVLSMYTMRNTVNIVHVDTGNHFAAIHEALRHIDRQGYSVTCLQILHRIMNIFSEMETSRVNEQPRLQKLARLAKDLIDATPNYNITVARLSELSHYCERHLERAFKECYGIPLKQYIQNCKVEQAKQMIQYSGYSLKEIGNRLGYCDYNHFSYAFRSITGESPAHFAKREVSSREEPKN